MVLCSAPGRLVLIEWNRFICSFPIDRERMHCNYDGILANVLCIILISHKRHTSNILCMCAPCLFQCTNYVRITNERLSIFVVDITNSFVFQMRENTTFAMACNHMKNMCAFTHLTACMCVCVCVVLCTCMSTCVFVCGCIRVLIHMALWPKE